MPANATMGDPKSDLPCVSCLTVTLAVESRLSYLKRSLAAYCSQTYPHRELVLVIDRGTLETRREIRRAVETLNRPEIRIVEPAGERTLGALRNIAVREAEGDFVCPWDDDDFHHPERLARQAAVLIQPDAISVGMTEMMMFFALERRLFLTNFAATPLAAIPNSIMWRKSANALYPETGPEAAIGEDMELLRRLRALGGFHCLRGGPHLYVYVCHGLNTCNDSHLRMLVEKLAVSKGMLLRREAELRAGLARHDFGSGDVIVEGNNGSAFVIAGTA